MLQVADWLFILFHTALIAFNLFGWIPKKTRPWNLLTLALTAGSWFVMGLWNGMGYCIWTDLHWQIRERLGLDTPDSYVQFLIAKLTGAQLSIGTTNLIAGICFTVAVLASVTLNVRDSVARKRQLSRSSNT